VCIHSVGVSDCVFHKVIVYVCVYVSVYLSVSVSVCVVYVRVRVRVGGIYSFSLV